MSGTEETAAVREQKSASADEARQDTHEELRPTQGYVVVSVDASGSIVGVLEQPQAVDNEALREVESGGPLDALWPADLSAAVRENLRRVLKSRQTRSLRLDSAFDGRSYESIIMPQGRERATVLVRDVSAEREHIAQLERLAYTDEATGLPTREWLTAELDRIASDLKLRGGRAAVIAVEVELLDNATPHTRAVARDAIFTVLAGRLLTGLRGANDTGEEDLERYSILAHLGGNRFAIALPDIEGGADASATASRIIEMLEMPVEQEGVSCGVRAAAGIALYPQDGETAGDLVESALTALHDARHNGSGNQEFHSGTLRMRTLDRQDLELGLRNALHNEEFVLHFLPIVTADEHRPSAAEALLRWPKPVFGNDSIAEVINVAENTGMILPIGEWVFRQACTVLAAWKAQYPEFAVSVNVSAQEFSRASIVERTRQILDETGADANRVTIEITEHLLFRDAMKGFPVCNGLKRLGVNISVDDYGTGICSFEHISESPVDSVKIPPSFVTRVAENAAGRAACAAIVAMAHELGLTVIAEGVETAELATILEDMGCDCLQGFFFTEPLSIDELECWLNDAG